VDLFSWVGVELGGNCDCRCGSILMLLCWGGGGGGVQSFAAMVLLSDQGAILSSA